MGPKSSPGPIRAFPSQFGLMGDHEALREAREALPMYKHRADFVRLFRRHRTLIVVGETGSGKTTQIPQFLHELGETARGLVGVTQPRRVAAVTVSKRVADEMGTTVGGKVGYTIRFDDRTSRATRLKFLTDGMLMREALLSRTLDDYSVIVLDEAHERTLQTDVLFAVVKDAMRRRPDLRVVVMSATLDVDLFRGFFDDAGVLAVPGRTHPVEVLYALQSEEDYVDATLCTVMQVHLEERVGDILVFMTGQEDIEALAELLEEHEKRLPATAPKLVVTPIYAALSPDAQLRAFAPPPHGCRKVVIATNIAESSVTIPGVRYVVDAGLAKMRVFNPRTGAEALLPVPISKAQAWQRAGRAGREAPGKCFRLFTESAFERFRPSPVPEVQRVSLASVVLQLKVLGVGDVFAFDFLQPPSRDALKQAHVQLLRLGALESRGMTVTSLGRRMAALPLPPTLARLILFAPRHGCVDEAVALAAILSVDSLFIHPRQHREEAGRAHAKFAAPEGDHLAMLAAFNAYLEADRNKEWCRECFLNPRNLHQASRIRDQLFDVCERIRVARSACFLNLAQRSPQAAPGAHAKYRTLLRRQEAGPHPSSVLFMQRRAPEFVVFSELVETSRTYLRTVTAVEEEWLHELLPGMFHRRVGDGGHTAFGGARAAEKAEKAVEASAGQGHRATPRGGNDTAAKRKGPRPASQAPETAQEAREAAKEKAIARANQRAKKRRRSNGHGPRAKP